MLEQVRFAFIGGGNMAEALIKGLLSGLGKQLGSEVNLFSTLLPYLVPQNANPDSVTPQEASRR